MCIGSYNSTIGADVSLTLFLVTRSSNGDVFCPAMLVRRNWSASSSANGRSPTFEKNWVEKLCMSHVITLASDSHVMVLLKNRTWNNLKQITQEKADTRVIFHAKYHHGSWRYRHILLCLAFHKDMDCSVDMWKEVQLLESDTSASPKCQLLWAMMCVLLSSDYIHLLDVTQSALLVVEESLLHWNC